MSQQQYAQQRMHEVMSRIQKAETNYGRSSGSVKLIGASKKQTADLIEAFFNNGLQHVGENYLQEAIEKQNKLRSKLCWHFIGQIQSNKTKLIASHFSWVHGVDRLKIAKRLAAQNTNTTPIKLLIQLNLDDEHSKAGVSLSQAGELANNIAQLEGAKLKGFMAIPKARSSFEQQRATFAKARELLTQINQRYGLDLDELSMGMSGDLEAAIAEGSTMVRIGTDLFGARK